jgi:hypothetical protein
MPSRRLQTVCAVIFLLSLWLTNKQEESSLWVLLPTGALVVASFILGDLVNAWWFERHPPVLSAYEKAWLDRFAPYFGHLDPASRKQAESGLARDLIEKEFIHMGEQDIPGEWKLMALAPAAYLGLGYNNVQARRYSRIVFYNHPFPSPNQDYLHISETEHDDGVIILAVPQLEAAHHQASEHFNIALYQWGEVFANLYPVPHHWPTNKTEVLTSCCQVLGTTEAALCQYLGQTALLPVALAVYCAVLHPGVLEAADRYVAHYQTNVR